MRRPFYQAIASTLDAYKNCLSSCGYRREAMVGSWGGANEWADKHLESLEAMNKELPSGSGFDRGCKLDMDRSTVDRLVILAPFHHMDEHGYYDGWTDYTVVVKASLRYGGFELRITGRDRNQIKDYIADTFNHILGLDYDDATQKVVYRP